MANRPQPTAEEVQTCIDDLNAEMDEIQTLNRQLSRAMMIQQAQESEEESSDDNPQDVEEPASESSRAAGSGGHPPGTCDPRPAMEGQRGVDEVTQRTAAALSWVAIQEWERGNLKDRLAEVQAESTTEPIEADPRVNRFSRQPELLERVVCAFEDFNSKLAELVALLAENGVAVRDFGSEERK